MNVKQLTLQQVIDFIKAYTEWYEAKYPNGPVTQDGPPTGGDTPPPPPKP